MGRNARAAFTVAFPTVHETETDATESPYLVGLNLSGRRVVVVGGGTSRSADFPC